MKGFRVRLPETAKGRKVKTTAVTTAILTLLYLLLPEEWRPFIDVVQTF